MSSREEILNRLKKANQQNTRFDIDEPDWTKDDLISVDSDLVSEFKTQIEKVSGECYVIDSSKEIIDFIQNMVQQNLIDGVVAGTKSLSNSLNLPYMESAIDDNAMVLPCEALIASTGSVLVSSQSGGSRRNHVFPPVLFIVASKEQLVPYIKHGIEALKSKYERLPGMISLITGPSRTADIEKTLVLGAHGPEKLIVFLHSETIKN